MDIQYHCFPDVAPNGPVFSGLKDTGLPPVLFIHGFLSSRAQWRDNLEGLTRFCRPVFVEVLGHGRSPAPANDDAYLIGNYLSAFEAMRSHLGVSRWSVVGQSFGAGLALNYGLTSPNSVSEIVFTNSLSAVAKQEDLPGGGQGEAMINGVQYGGLAFLEKLPFHTNKIRHCSEAARAEFQEDSQKLNPAGIVKTMTRTTQGLNVRDHLSELKMPVCLINGVRERKFQPVRDWLAEHHSEMEIVDLDGGHSPNVECAEAFNKAVEDFILKGETQ